MLLFQRMRWNHFVKIVPLIASVMAAVRNNRGRGFASAYRPAGFQGQARACPFEPLAGFSRDAPGPAFPFFRFINRLKIGSEPSPVCH